MSLKHLINVLLISIYETDDRDLIPDMFKKYSMGVQ